MPRCEILDDKRNVVDTIIADQAFCEQMYPGRYRIVAEAVVETRQIDGPAVLNLLTDTELGDLLKAAKTDTGAELAYARLQRLPPTVINDPRLTAMLDKMVTARIISVLRKQQILGQ